MIKQFHRKLSLIFFLLFAALLKWNESQIRKNKHSILKSHLIYEVNIIPALYFLPFS